MTVPSRQADEALDRLIDYAGWATTPKPHKDAVATVRDELGRLRGEVVEWRTSIATEKLTWRAEAAEAEVRRLTEGLRYLDELAQAWIAADTYDGLGHVERRRVAHVRAKMVGDKARALLAASPSGGGGAK